MRILTVGCSLAGLAQEPNPTAGKTARYLKLKYDKQKNQTTVALKRMSLSSAMAKEVTNVTEVAQLILLITAVSTICVSKWDQ